MQCPCCGAKVLEGTTRCPGCKQEQTCSPKAFSSHLQQQKPPETHWVVVLLLFLGCDALLLTVSCAVWSVEKGFDAISLPLTSLGGVLLLVLGFINLKRWREESSVLVLFLALGEIIPGGLLLLAGLILMLFKNPGN